LKVIYTETIGSRIEIHSQTGRIQKMNGHQHWPMDWQLDQHILAYIGCKFKAYLSRDNW